MTDRLIYLSGIFFTYFGIAVGVFTLITSFMASKQISLAEYRELIKSGNTSPSLGLKMRLTEKFIDTLYDLNKRIIKIIAITASGAFITFIFISLDFPKEIKEIAFYIIAAFLALFSLYFFYELIKYIRVFLHRGATL